MNMQKLGKKNFWKIAIVATITLAFILPGSAVVVNDDVSLGNTIYVNDNNTSRPFDESLVHPTTIQEGVDDVTDVDMLLKGNNYTLTVNTVGNGSVILDPPGGIYTEGTSVELNATADQGWTFSFWSGNLTGTTNPDTVTMDGNKTVNAIFVQDIYTYTLTINIVGNGSVAKDPDLALYPDGTIVELTAIPNLGWSFSHWAGDLTGGTNPDTITMDGNKTVNATFTQDTYTLTIYTNGNGSVTKDPDQPTYIYDTVVKLTATADTNWSFSKWNGDLSGRTNPETIVMDSNKNVTAVFLVTQVEISPRVQMVKKGETFTVSVKILPGEPITGVSFDSLYFDHTLIHANSVTEGDLFDPYTTSFDNGSIDNALGTITNVSGSIVGTENVTETRCFCNVSFTAQQEIGTSVLDLEGVIVSNVSGDPVPITVYDGKAAIGWSVALDFSESGGRSDYAVFGEAADANDGPPADSYDLPKPPGVPTPPYLRAWFDDDIPTPYHELSENYRMYPDVYKIWNLSVQWDNLSSSPTSVTISWNINEFDDCEYNFIVLKKYDPFDAEWDFAADMLTENEYTYTPRYFGSTWLKDRFQIFTIFDTTPPEITDMMLTPSDPLDTIIGWENVSCTVIDTGVGVNQVKLMVTYPDTTNVEYLMANIPGTDVYYCNTTFTYPGDYSYHLWTDNAMGNNATSSPEQFSLPMNEDVDMNGQVYFEDLVAIVMMYGDTGANGWVREDVDNSGDVYFEDLVRVVMVYGEYWK